MVPFIWRTQRGEVARAFETRMSAGPLDSRLQACHTAVSVRQDETCLAFMLHLQPVTLVRDLEMVPMLPIWSLLLLHRIFMPRMHFLQQQDKGNQTQNR